MRTVVASLVGMLPLDEAGRRAVDETFADWHHETGEATTAAGRLVAAVRSAAGIASVIGSVLDVGARRIALQVGILVLVAVLAVVANASSDGFRDAVSSQNARLSRLVK